MSIQLVTGFLVNAAESLDNRIVASGSTDRNAIPYKYEGMRVFDTSNNRSYFWTNGSFQPEITDQVNGSTSYVPKFTSQYYIGDSYIYDAGSKIGIGTNNPTGDYTYVQIGGMSLSEDPQYYSGQGMPFVIHKGGNTVLGHNWYYSGVNNFAFDLNLSSVWMTFDVAGCLSIKTRKGGTPFNTNSIQSIYISEQSKVGIGNGWKLSNPPTEVLDVDGNVKVSGTVFTSYAQISSSATGQSYGLVLHDNTPLVLPGPTPVPGQGLFIDWSSNTLSAPVSSVRSYWGGIGGYSRGNSGGDLIFYTSPSYIAIPGDATRPKRLIIKNTGEIAIGEDPTLPVANGPGTIDTTAIANLFNSSIPKFEVITGTNAGTYKDLMVLRHPVSDATAVLRRLGYIVKLSTETSSTESNKSGGFIVESTSANATNPSLHLILGQNKRLSIDNDGSVYFPEGSSTIDTMSVLSGLFPSVKPKFQVNTGSTTGTYNELMMLRHSANAATSVTRRLGYMMALSNESTITETDKSGGMILESVSINAMEPKLQLVVSNVPQVTIDGDGDTIFRTSYGLSSNYFTKRLSFPGVAYAQMPFATPYTDVVDIVTSLGNKQVLVEAVSMIQSITGGKFGGVKTLIQKHLRSFDVSPMGIVTPIAAQTIAFTQTIGTNDMTALSIDIISSGAGKIGVQFSITDPGTLSGGWSWSYSTNYTVSII